MALAEDGLLALYEEYTALESTLDALKITHQYTSNSLIESANAVSQQSWTSIQASKKTLADRYAIIVATVGVILLPCRVPRAVYLPLHRPQRGGPHQAAEQLHA